jgi:predicted HTH domain antitoxin
MSLLISDEVLNAIDMSAEELLQEIAIILFQQERFTLAQASRFAQLDQIAFQRLLAKRKISLHYDLEELHQDIALLEAHDWR